MSNEVLNSLLKEYEQKKVKAELDLEKRKEDLYKKIPRLQQIEDELNKKAENLKYEKACIIQNADLPFNYLKPNYECPICKDTGYVSNNDYKTEMCSCLKQKLLDASFHKSNMANLDKENFDTFNENVFSDEIDLAKYRFNISPRTNIKNIKQNCLEFVKNFDDPTVKNLLFTGNTGLR